MKTFTNLPASLRMIFSFLRVMTIVLGVLWLLILTFSPWIQKTFGHDSHLMISFGQISLPTAPDTLRLNSDLAKPGALRLQRLSGALSTDLTSSDPILAATLRKAVIPPMLAVVIFGYVFFTALRNLCANLERGEIFNDANFTLFRRIGLSLIVYSVLAGALEIWSAHQLAGYFSQHVTLTGLDSALSFHGNIKDFLQLPIGRSQVFAGVLAGFLVLVVAEAFRQGLKLKTENDLTI